MLSKEWSKFKSGSDIRGVALEGVKDMPVDLTEIGRASCRERV